jgi:flagellar hook-length control protein FliK
MITCNSTTKLIFSQGQDSTAKLKPKSSLGASDSEFKTVFNKTLDNTAKPTDNGARDDSKIPNTSDDKYKSFRDVKASKQVKSGNASAAKAADSQKSQRVDEDKDKSSDKSGKHDEVIDVLAQMLGLQPNELVKLANDAGFTEEDLKDANKMSLFVEKLSGLLQLNDSQKAMMNNLAMEVLKQVKELKGNQTQAAANTADASEVKAATDSVPGKEAVVLSKLADEVKQKLDQLIQKTSTGQEPLSADISKVIEQMKSRIQAKVTPVNQEADSIQDIVDADKEKVSDPAQPVEEKNTAGKKEDAKTEHSKKEIKQESAVSSNTTASTTVNTTDAQTGTSNDQNFNLNQQNAHVVGDVKIGISNNVSEVQKTEFTVPQPVKGAEVVNQVVEQAKVIIGQDKSEMVIQLKPDHLGKLELKVVTEQGLVAAKFIAESHQVKEIIETNMQLLKDSLQKQGISVDSVSVQVGNGNAESKQQSSYFGRSSSDSRQQYGSDNAATVLVSANAEDALQERLAQYSEQTSTVDFTA